jgi:hypothetical protein
MSSTAAQINQRVAARRKSDSTETGQQINSYALQELGQPGESLQVFRTFVFFLIPY